MTTQTPQKVTAAALAATWPRPGPEDHKYTRGVVGVVAGTEAYPGAALLVTTAAVLAGAGMVRYCGPAALARAVVANRPEVVLADGAVSSWVLGPGLPPIAQGDGEDQQALSQGTRARAAMRQACHPCGNDAPPVPAVVDAGALPLVADRCPPSVVLTPHAGELMRLLGNWGVDATSEAVRRDPVKWATQAYELTGATVLLKGSVSTVVGPGVVYQQDEAPHWLATAGSGDVLSGLLGTMLAQRSAEVMATPALAAGIAAGAALLHGLAAQRANPGGPVAALEVARALPRTIAKLLQ